TAKALSAKRTNAAQDFEKRVQKAMRELELPKAVLHVSVEHALTPGLTNTADDTPAGSLLDVLSASGADTIDFLVSLNAGEDPKPMRKVASRGEISRIMLAIKSVVAGKDDVSTLI